MRWFRCYGDMPDDPKIGSLNDAEFRTWMELLCLACKEEKNGLTSATIENIDWLLRRPARESVNILEARNLIRRDKSGYIVITKWQDRQTRSDSSKERVAEYRNRLKKLGKTTDYLKHKEEICNRYSNACVYCGVTDNLCIDHLIPLSRGGDNHPDNLVCSCKKCNSGKAGKLFEETGYSFFNPLAEKFLVTVTNKIGNGYDVTRNGYCNGLDKIREEEKEKKKKEKAAFVANEIDLPHWLPKQDWQDYKTMRQRIRKPMTARAEKIAIAKLLSLKEQGYPPEDVLQHSILNAYQGLFAPKPPHAPGTPSPIRRPPSPSPSQTEID